MLINFYSIFCMNKLVLNMNKYFYVLIKVESFWALILPIFLTEEFRVYSDCAELCLKICLHILRSAQNALMQRPAIVFKNMFAYLAIWTECIDEKTSNCLKRNDLFAHSISTQPL